MIQLKIMNHFLKIFKKPLLFCSINIHNPRIQKVCQKIMIDTHQLILMNHLKKITILKTQYQKYKEEDPLYDNFWNKQISYLSRLEELAIQNVQKNNLYY